jgi:hypothetical protein
MEWQVETDLVDERLPAKLDVFGAAATGCETVSTRSADVEAKEKLIHIASEQKLQKKKDIFISSEHTLL